MSGGLLQKPLPALEDAEGERVPPNLPPIVDAHVHLFPDRLGRAVRDWFDRHGWPVRYRGTAEDVVQMLLGRGVAHLVALHYAHKPGIARSMNRFVADLARKYPQVTGVATVLPGEPDALAILDEAFALGLRGVKLHCHVQCFAPDDPAALPIYAWCEERGLPVVLHAGREPSSPALKCDPHALCSPERVECVVRAHPELRLVIPHLGCDEFEAYARLVCAHEHVFVDTSMVLADYFPMVCSAVDHVRALIGRRPERVLYGTDLPNLPFAWDRELRRLVALDLPHDVLLRVLSRNACELFGIQFPTTETSSS